MTLEQIAIKRDEIEARVLCPDYQATTRDVAEAAELVNQYIDELERLERTVTVAPFTCTDRVADKIITGWYPHG